MCDIKKTSESPLSVTPLSAYGERARVRGGHESCSEPPTPLWVSLALQQHQAANASLAATPHPNLLSVADAQWEVGLSAGTAP